MGREPRGIEGKAGECKLKSLMIDKSVFIDRSPEDVFAAWSTADALASWFAPMADQVPDVTMEFVAGGRYSIVMRLPDGSVHTTVGVFQDIVANEKITMTWRCDAFADPESLVEVHFERNGSGTNIRLLHKDFDASDTCDAHRGGWDACLAQLAKTLTAEQGQSK